MNLFSIPSTLPEEEELKRVLLTDKNVRVEHIVSTGQTTPENEWCVQDEHEWVCVLSGVGELTYDDGLVQRLNAGETTFIPAGSPHQVSYTSGGDDPCVWLCVFWTPAEQ